MSSAPRPALPPETFDETNFLDWLKSATACREDWLAWANAKNADGRPNIHPLIVALIESLPPESFFQDLGFPEDVEAYRQQMRIPTYEQIESFSDSIWSWFKMRDEGFFGAQEEKHDDRELLQRIIESAGMICGHTFSVKLVEFLRETVRTTNQNQPSQ